MIRTASNRIHACHPATTRRESQLVATISVFITVIGKDKTESQRRTSFAVGRARLPPSRKRYRAADSAARQEPRPPFALTQCELQNAY